MAAGARCNTAGVARLTLGWGTQGFRRRPIWQVVPERRHLSVLLAALSVLLAIAVAPATTGAMVGRHGSAQRRVRGAAGLHRDRRAARRRHVLRHADLADRRHDRSPLRVREEQERQSARRRPRLGRSRSSSARATSPTPRSASGRGSCGAATAVFRWDGTPPQPRVALLALDRAMPSARAARRAAPRRGQVAADRGLRQRLDEGQDRPSALKAALIDAADPASCSLVSETFDPSWLFCGPPRRIRPFRAERRATATRAGRRSRTRTRSTTSSSRASSARLARGLRVSRSYLVLVSSERGFIDARSPPRRRHGTRCATTRRRGGQGGPAPHRREGHADTAHQRRQQPPLARRHRLLHDGGKRISGAVRSVSTNRWVQFNLAADEALLGLVRRARTGRRSSRTSRARRTSSSETRTRSGREKR